MVHLVAAMALISFSRTQCLEMLAEVCYGTDLQYKNILLSKATNPLFWHDSVQTVYSTEGPLEPEHLELIGNEYVRMRRPGKFRFKINRSWIWITSPSLDQTGQCQSSLVLNQDYWSWVKLNIIKIRCNNINQTRAKNRVITGPRCYPKLVSLN